MPCDTKRRQIGQAEYAVTQMPPSEALPYQAEFGTLLAEVAGPLMRSAEGGEMTEDAVGSALGDIAAALRQHVPPKRFSELVTELVVSPNVIRNDGDGGRQVILDIDFSGDEMPNLYRVFAFVIEVNFAPFFGAGGLGGLAEKFGKVMPLAAVGSTR